MKKYLVKLADHLDKKGLTKEADYVDWILKQADPFDDLDAELEGSGAAKVPAPKTKEEGKMLAQKAEKALKGVTDPFDRMDIFSDHHISKVDANQTQCRVRFSNAVTVMISAPDHPELCKK